MKPSRRKVLVGASAAALVGLPACKDDTPQGRAPAGTTPAPDRAPEPAAWEPGGSLDEAAFAWGVAAGDATEGGVLLSVRTLEGEVTLEVVAQDGEAWVPVTSEVVPVVEGVAQRALTGLAADTAHRYVFRSADGTRRSEVGRFRTALGADGFRKIVLGATSCLGGGNPEWTNLTHAAADQLDLFLLLGDTVYADGSVTIEDYRDEWRTATAKPAMRQLLASTSVVATWDDHEVANNWTLGPGSALQDHVEPEQVEAGLAAFREAIPMGLGPGGSGLWRSLVWGDVLELIVLDSRGERDDEARICSDEQLAFAIDRLQRSTATFKLVLVSVHMIDHTALFSTVNQEDRWQGYPTQRDALLAAAEATTGVIFVTGDMHYGAIQKVGPAGGPGEHLWEVAAGPSGSELFLIDDIAGLLGGFPEQYADVLVDWNYARLVLDPGTRTATVQLVDDAGAVRAERILEL